ncbi:hypothetical protein [Sporosarcina sp. Te-1]|uniref:hypothetical protein n=1 Tax=Sporosarcina sp. Te-1 TaxID=2818390 RepID=UPI001A9D5713|nr:hypothetical protein [Sporosarcina sp. Te-1]QTD40342.1 hypothetical protein J3U78_16360 [Sporosarcina sp. Te-1]
MDIILFAFNALIILLYITLIAFITPIIMKVLQKRNYDIFFQLIPVLVFTFITSLVVFIGTGGFEESLLFFRLTTVVSLIMIGILLFVTLAMKKLWHQQYEKMLDWIVTFKTERSFSLK